MAVYEKFLTKEQLNRIVVDEENSIITLDVHGLGKRETERFMNNLIAATRGDFTFKIIHGYNHGVVLKNFIVNEFKNKRVNNVVGMIDNNPGVTHLSVKRA